MLFKPVDTNKLMIRLSRSDMIELDLKYDHIHSQDESVRNLITNLLILARSRTGFHLRGPTLLVEIYPDERDGCVIYISGEGADPEEDSGRNAVPSVFEFSDLEILLDACIKLFSAHSHRIYKSGLYRYGEKYRLIVRPLERSDSVCTGFLSEYGHPVGSGELACAFTSEHGEPILEKNAIDTLAFYLG